MTADEYTSKNGSPRSKILAEVTVIMHERSNKSESTKSYHHKI